jgi:hypothetical protein
MEDDTFELAPRLLLGSYASVASDFSCIWSPHPRTAITGDVNSESRAAVKICGPNGCISPWDGMPDGQQSFEFAATEYVRLDANAPDFAEKTEFVLSVKKKGNFLNAEGVFDNDGLVSEVTLHERALSPAHPLMEAEKGPAGPLLAPHPPPPPLAQALGPFQREARMRSNFASIIAVLQVIALSVVIVGGVLCIVYAFLPGARRADDAEGGLLGSAPAAQSRFPAWGFFPPGGYGVPVFPGQGYPPQAYAYSGAGGAQAFPAAQFPQTPETGAAAPPQ